MPSGSKGTCWNTSTLGLAIGPCPHPVICVRPVVSLKWERLETSNFRELCAPETLLTKQYSWPTDSCDLTNRLRLASLIGLSATLLVACSSTVSMQMPTIPEPRLEKIPVDVAVRIPDEFHNFVHTEDVLGKDKWTIELGNSNANCLASRRQ